MNYLKNRNSCVDSNWGGGYTSEIMVTLNSYEEENKEDWENILEKYCFNCQEKKERLKKYFEKKGHLYGAEELKELGEVLSIRLKPEVVKWLKDNIEDTKEGKGWCMGNDNYIAINPDSFCLFFQRRRDAMAFIKRWSKWKKPVSYLQYYTGVRKELDLKTLKYKKQ